MVLLGRLKATSNIWKNCSVVRKLSVWVRTFAMNP